MKKSHITILLIILTVVIILVITIDFKSTKVENRTVNQFELNLDSLKQVDEDLITYKEKRQLILKGEPHALAFANDTLFVLIDSSLELISTNGEVIEEVPLPENGNALTVFNHVVLIAYKNYLATYSLNGDLKKQSAVFEGTSLFTSIVATKENIFVADAGNRKVQVFNHQLKNTGEFEGVSGAESLHGFIVPSAYFDVAVNADNELWVVNPGMHSIQQYSTTGDLIKFWEKESNNVEGFSGCCNPAQICILSNGNFITSEKKIVRIKEYSSTGELLGVVAPPKLFTDEGKAPEVTCDEQGNIWALDFDKKMLRLFVKN